MKKEKKRLYVVVEGLKERPFHLGLLGRISHLYFLMGFWLMG
uniref:Uncharacterized protein n=1 Tax=Rhizophora mucronata TaxID=61149 RepID=A0A2P2NP72_RHIMU